ncbi:hypothetical protein DERP_002957 [Dermatophagoides pteronyssinus]|uniref:Uncharacterized protein n=1 Tax=Dermatophagoides pteronyssinus TaxID=6956 RepID=A0ABQ8JW96_DERPT|nr:hypothetical protein DERP_002957 [Dermatophagoides pteronyssinus]
MIQSGKQILIFLLNLGSVHNSENGENCLSCSINIDLRSFKRKLIYVDRFSNGEVLNVVGVKFDPTWIAEVLSFFPLHSITINDPKEKKMDKNK